MWPDHDADDRLGLELQRKSQSYWAGRLGTTTGGTAISAMVRVINASTGYDRRGARRHLHHARHRQLRHHPLDEAA